MKSKNLNLFLLLIFSIALLFSGCTKKNISNDTNPSNSPFKIEPSAIQEEEEHLNINLRIPIVTGFTDAEVINNQISTKLEKYIAEVRDAAENMAEEGIKFSATLQADYQYFYNNDIASLWINFDNFTGGAHGYYWIDSYTFNTSTGEIYSFPDLFVEGSNGLDFIKKEIFNEVAEDDDFFPTASETINNYNGEYPFLINGDELVVYFPLYEIAPYSEGMEDFTFDAEDLKNYIKPEILEAMMGQKEVKIPFFER